jgi:hypothetical protein
MALAAAPPATTEALIAESPALLTLAAFTERAAHLKLLMEEARGAEADAFAALRNRQDAMLLGITKAHAGELALSQHAYATCEDEWRACTLYTAELRAEMADLTRERHGAAYNEEETLGSPQRQPVGGGPSHCHAVALMGVAQQTTRGTAQSLDSAKCVAIASADDVSPRRRPLVRPAFPDVDPVWEANAQHLPMGEQALQREFARFEGAAADAVALADVCGYFVRMEPLGVPASPTEFVVRNLARFDARLRAAQARHGAARVVEGGAFAVSFQQFAYLCLKWAQH